MNSYLSNQSKFKDTNMLAILLILTISSGMFSIYDALAMEINVDANCVDSDPSNSICDDTLTFRTIQGAIDTSSSGDVIITSSGTYDISSSVLIDKQITLQGTGSGSDNTTNTIIDLNGNIFNLKGGTSDTQRITLKDLRVINGAHNAVTIKIDGFYEINNVSFIDNDGTVVRTEKPAYSPDIVVKNSFFQNNGFVDGNNPADFKFYEFEGNARIENVEIIKGDFFDGTDRTVNSNAIDIRGQTCNTGAFTIHDTGSTIGNVDFIDLIISGTPNKNGLLIQCYADISGITLSGVDLSGVEPGWVGFALDHEGETDFDIGNTILPSLALWENSKGVDATNATFVNTNTGFDIEDVVYHAPDEQAPGKQVGLVTWTENNVYVTPTSGNIQRGIDTAVSGDIVNVKSGTYPISSTIVIDKSVTLLGSQSNVDPRPSSSTTRVAGDSSESIVDGGGTIIGIFQINADDVTINGFEIKSGTGDLIKSSEGTIKLRPILRYNIIHNSSGDEGIQLKSVDDALIEFNHVFNTQGDGINIAFSHNSLIQFNEVHNIISPDAAIYAYNDGTRGFINATIQNNLVYDVLANDGIKLGDKSGLDESLHGGSILSNIVHDTRQDSITVKASNVLVDGNEIYNSASENGAIYVDFNPDGIDITNNIIRDNGVAVLSGISIDDPATTYGVRVGKSPGEVGTNVRINNNEIKDNEGGVFFNFQSGDNLNATNNYWGSSKGPTHSSNLKGKGDTVSDNISFDPWYLNSKLSNLSSEQTGNKFTPQSKSVKLDTDNNGGAVNGQASLPSGIEELELGNDAVLDLATNIESAVGNSIDVGGQAKDLTSFSSGDLIGEDFTVTKTVGDKNVIVKKAVKMKSGTTNQPIIITNTVLPSVSVSIPDGTTILAPDEWTGTIQPPKTASSSGTAPSGFSVGGTVIEVGSSDVVLIFDTPVNVLLSGVTGNVGYKPAGSSTWIQITNTCGGPFDNPSNPEFPGECFISNGVDTKIFTYHFTTFGSLDVKSSDNNGGGGGGGDRTKPVLQSYLISSQDSNIFGGMLKLDDSAKNSASIFEIGDTINLEFPFYENSGVESLEHVTLFTNIRNFDDRYDSDLYVEWNKDQPLKVYDAEGFLNDATNVSFVKHDTNVVMVFHLNFIKPMSASNIVLNFWDYNRNSALVTFNDAWVIVEPIDGIISESPTDDIITNDDMMTDLIGIPQKEKSPTIPPWIKSNAGWWGMGEIEDTTFTNGIQYLIQEKIINVPSLPNVSKEPNEENIEELQPEIPKWIKHSATWWSEDLISENEFMNALQWLISNEIITI